MRLICWGVAGLRKDAKLAWNLLVITLIALAVLVAMLIFSVALREKIIEAFQIFVDSVFGG